MDMKMGLLPSLHIVLINKLAMAKCARPVKTFLSIGMSVWSFNSLDLPWKVFGLEVFVFERNYVMLSGLKVPRVCNITNMWILTMNSTLYSKTSC